MPPPARLTPCGKPTPPPHAWLRVRRLPVLAHAPLLLPLPVSRTEWPLCGGRGRRRGLAGRQGYRRPRTPCSYPQHTFLTPNTPFLPQQRSDPVSSPPFVATCVSSRMPNLHSVYSIRARALSSRPTRKVGNQFSRSACWLPLPSGPSADPLWKIIMSVHCTSVAAAFDECKLAKLSSENLSSTGRALPLWSTGGISPTPTESVCSGYSSPEEGSPEDAFMQRCQQQIARIVAASSGDGVETQLPMLSRMGQLPPGAHMRLTGAHLRLASSLDAVTEPRTLPSDIAYESRNGRKREWQVTGGDELPHTATWHNGSAKFAKPDDWVPAAPEMLQPDLSVALGELAGASAHLLSPFPLPRTYSTNPRISRCAVADDFFDFSPAVGAGLFTDGDGYPDLSPFL